LTLATQIEAALGDNAAKSKFLEHAIRKFIDPQKMDDWALGWMMTAARLAEHPDLLKKAQAEINLRAAGKTSTGIREGVLPEMHEALKKI
jgi:hypothetical protein